MSEDHAPINADFQVGLHDYALSWEPFGAGPAQPYFVTAYTAADAVTQWGVMMAGRFGFPNYVCKLIEIVPRAIFVPYAERNQPWKR